MKILQPGKIGNVEIKNRMVMPPMAVGLGGADRLLGETQYAFYEKRAKEGVGLIISSAFAIDVGNAGIVEAGQSSLAVPGAEKGLKELIDRVHAAGSKIVIQLLHPGRQTMSLLNNGEQPVAPSAIKEADFLELPRELSTEEVKTMIQNFVKCAKMAFDCGADGVELHGAHGYIIYQFMNERANKRTDEYGGSYENRMRFITEIVEGIKAFKPENTILSIRYNVTDRFEGGLTIEEGIRMAKDLEAMGFDAINASCGTYTNQLMASEPAPIPEGCRTDFVKALKEAINIPVIAVNNIKTPAVAEQLLQDGICDFVAVARGLLADPCFMTKLTEGKADRIHNCIACCHCLDAVQSGVPVECSVNPMLGKETTHNENTIRKDGAGRKIVIIGGGAGGMQAAITAAQRGFAVTIIEKDAELGGSLIMASKGTGKYKVANYVKSQILELEDLGVEVKLNTEVTSAEEIIAMAPYAVVVAVGGKPVCPPIPGLDGDNVYLAHDILKTDAGIENKKVALVGSGMTGLETAEVLVEKGNSIVVYDMLDEIAKGANLSNKVVVMQNLAMAGTEFKPNHKLKEVKAGEVVLENVVSNEIITEPADVVVLSLGVKANKSFEEILEGKVEKLICIGDCADGTKIVDATGAAFRAMWDL